MRRHDGSRQRVLGYSLIEILCVISILSILTLFGGAIGSGILGYYRLRGGAELLVQNIRSIREYAMARGSIPTPGGVSGVYFFNQNLKADRTGPEAGAANSFLVYGPPLRSRHQVDKPTGGLVAGAVFLPFVVNLPAGCLLRTSAGGARLVTNGDVIEFGVDGIITAGSLPELFMTEPAAGTFTITMWGHAGAPGIRSTRGHAALTFDPGFFPPP